MSYQDTSPNAFNQTQEPGDQKPEAPIMNFQGYENLGFVMPIRKNFFSRYFLHHVTLLTKSEYF